MLSFRNRLLILLIGLVVGAQTVTLFTALPRTRDKELERADEQLVKGARIAQRLLEYREGQLANAVSALSADYAFHKAIVDANQADGSSVQGKLAQRTVASALGNLAQRVGADLTLLLDLDGNVTRGEGTAPIAPELVAAIAAANASDADGAQFLVTPGAAGSGNTVYQVFTSPVQAPDEIGRVAVGFIVNDKLAQDLSGLVGVQVAFLAGDAGTHVVASSLQTLQRGAPAPQAPPRGRSAVTRIGARDFLGTVTHLNLKGTPVDLALFKSMDEVMKPYRELALNFGIIIGLTLAITVVAGIYLGGGAARPVQRLAAGAARIAAGDYSERIDGSSGGRELANLAQAFNTMQNGIAERESRLLHQARHDGATGLPNRLFAEEWLAQRLAGLRNDTQVGVVLVAVTNLREISASLGFDMAGQLVRHLARTIGGFADDNSLVARVDATHFMVAVTSLSDSGMETLLADVRQRASLPLATAGITLQAAVVLGAALAPRHGDSAGELLRCAEAALETAIQQQQPQALFERASDVAQRRALQLGADLPEALRSGQLYLQYQPKFRITDRMPRGVEALLRWRHAEFGNVSPAEFIPIAERTGACGLLTRWVLRAALAQLAAWQRQGIHIEMAVNLSAADIIDPDMLEFILGALRDARLATSSLTLEITESVLLHEPELARRNMELLRVAGVRFSIDDFGTGYSSLSQLRELPADELKIDQSFVRVITQGEEHVAVIRAIVDLGRGLRLRTVAEGVEEEAQWRLLAELGCDYVQGYLTGRPQSAEELTPQLRAALDGGPAADSRTASLRVLELRRRD
ncbi:MAG TPA: EAL domain-containing protein [Steroidobacteraceae bacterium]|nr:EAL domain-containing protein [Steroidobacteraceae bacterium]